MKLYKGCEKKYNLNLKGKTLRIGTLYGYRAAENPDIKDEHEGKYRFELNISDPAIVKNKYANAIINNIQLPTSEDLYFRGGVVIRAEELGYTQLDNEQVSIVASALTIERESPNQFLFCMSKCEGVPPSISHKYDGHWSIGFESKKEFGFILAQELLSQVKKNPKLVIGLNPDKVSNLKIQLRFSEISYYPRLLSKYSMTNFDVEEILEKIENMAFTKPPKFEEEKEYRFSFEVTDGFRYYPPACKGVTVKSSSMIHLLTK